MWNMRDRYNLRNHHTDRKLKYDHNTERLVTIQTTLLDTNGLVNVCAKDNTIFIGEEKNKMSPHNSCPHHHSVSTPTSCPSTCTAPSQVKINCSEGSTYSPTQSSRKADQGFPGSACISFLGRPQSRWPLGIDVSTHASITSSSACTRSLLCCNIERPLCFSSKTRPLFLTPTLNLQLANRLCVAAVIIIWVGGRLSTCPFLRSRRCRVMHRGALGNNSFQKNSSKMPNSHYAFKRPP